MTNTDCDVLIIGAGMAGGLLARQLSVEQPQLRITLLDSKTSFDWHIGESTVEVFDDYATRNCKLGPYMSANHIIKHGLRFWFDSPDKNLPMCELSEQGRSRYTSLNRGIQVDRARFDRDLCEINRRSGVDVRLGVKVLQQRTDGSEGMQLDAASGHEVMTSDGPIRCRHLVDAGGRRAPLARQLNLVSGKIEPFTGSYWGRFAHTVSIDELGDDAWRARVEGTLRWSSTNHFMYDGYWIWLIPIDADTVSIGVTFDKRLVPLKLRNAEELTAFFRSHRCLDELLGTEAESLDFMGLSHIDRGASQFYSEDRWYLTGMSGLFVDPLFSNSSAVIALGNRLIASLIEADVQGDQKVFSNRCRHFNIAMGNIYRRQRESFDCYHAMGSFDAFVNWQTLRYHSILNYDIPAQHADYKPMIERVDSHAGGCDCALGRWTASQLLGQAGDALTREFVEFVEARGQYHARNTGYFHEKTERDKTRQKTIDLEFGEAEMQESKLNWECFVRYYLVRMCDMQNITFDEPTFAASFDPDWTSGQTLDALSNVQLAHAGSGEPATAPAVRWDLKGPMDDQLLHEAPWWCRFTGPDGQQLA